MAHFPTHTGGALTRGQPFGISQVGVDRSRGRRVFAGGLTTEVRALSHPGLNIGQTTTAVNTMASVTAEDFARAGCGFLVPGSPAHVLCMLGADIIPGGDDTVVPGSDLGECPIPLRREADGSCVFPSSPADIDQGGAMGGVAVMGRYGAALAPSTESRIHRDCLPGMVLGDDNLCYNRRDIRNADRKYPRGARPLGTPGEMSALRKAASFGRRMETTVKRMQKIGVLKKPAPRKASRSKPKQLVSGPGITVIDTE